VTVIVQIPAASIEQVKVLVGVGAASREVEADDIVPSHDLGEPNGAVDCVELAINGLAEQEFDFSTLLSGVQRAFSRHWRSLELGEQHLRRDGPGRRLRGSGPPLNACIVRAQRRGVERDRGSRRYRGWR
jgi:hypothetical protein